MESKRERFARIAERRTRRIIDRIRILANCSNRSVYEYTERDVRKIFSAIEAEMKIARERLLPQTRKPFELENV